MTLAPIRFNFEDLTPQPPAASPTVIGVVGTGLTGTPQAALSTPVAVSNLAEATTQFGETGTLIDACKVFFATNSLWVVGVRYDESLTGTALATAIEAAINKLAESDITGHNPTLILAPGLTVGGESTSIGAINANISAGVTGIALAAAATTLVSVGDYLRIGDEIMEVTAVTSQSAFTVTRGALGTTATAHADGDNISLYSLANAYASDLKTVATRMEAYALLDITATSYDLARLYIEANKGDRALPIPQRHNAFGQTNIWGSVFFAAVIAANDVQNGVRDNISNRAIQNVNGVSPSYSFGYTDGASQAIGIRNAGGTIVVRDEEGDWIAWGGQTDYDDVRADLGTGRISDIIKVRARRIIRRVVHRGIFQDTLGVAADNVTRMLADMVADQDIIGGSCVVDPALTEAQINAGNLSFNLPIDFVRNAETVELNVRVQ